ncbi:unnamed protein product [Phaedon cochleariae]|uniref:Tesmin/TSO1-like CXC domain-containing protein n=1 Tax=Phaedon cochleariae TaxID=80249 RepID=A0A9N9X4Y6_PHACE|nr:unnamed protein product [Phaedon cochleariae]
MKLSKFPLFKTGVKKNTNLNLKSQVTASKNDCSLFSRLYIATSANRPNDLGEFFSHENQEYPPSISVMGKLRTSDSKSDLTKYLSNLSEECTADSVPIVQAKILDGAVIEHMLKPGTSVTFGDYISNIFLNYVRKESATVNRLDLVFDRYLENSLKNGTRQKRGEGSRIRVTLSTKVPKGWENFLRHADNKTALFELLAESISNSNIPGKTFFATLEDSVVSSPFGADSSSMAPCNHEEADTRLFVHLADAVAHGCEKVTIRTCDTGVLVIAVSCIQQLPQLQELWVHFGMGKHSKFLAAHEIAIVLGPEKSESLLGFHAFTGCDTVSYFKGIGKLTAVNAWLKYPGATDGFKALQDGTVVQAMGNLEVFVVSTYTRTASCETVNECRRVLFTKSDRQLKSIPPTRNALEQHAKRASIQSQVWRQSLERKQNFPDSADFGWKICEEGWEPVWRTIPVASEACEALIKCSCRKGCVPARCKCLKNGLKCCELCKCTCRLCTP